MRTLPFALFLPAMLVSGCGGDSEEAQDLSLLKVELRDLQITVKENAELQAQRETVVRSEVEGQATIIFLIEEGKIVQQGEKLVELDASELIDKRANQGITVAKAEAGLAQAQKALEILQKELTAKRRTAESNLRIAELELEKFLGRDSSGSEDVARGRNSDMVKKLKELVETPVEAAAKDASADPQVVSAIQSRIDPRRYAPLVKKIGSLLVDADGKPAVDRDMGDLANKVLQQVDKIRLAMADLKFQEAYFGHSQRLAEKQFITPNELEKDKIEFQRRLSQVGLAWNDLDLLVSYELFKNKEKLAQDVDNARLELARVLATNEAEVTKADSSLKSAEAEYKLAKDRLDNLERQIKNAIVYAPTPGLVIYARQERGRMGSEAIREGIQVRDRQDLIVLPDTTRMQTIVKVQEAVVNQVRVGQMAHLSIEAFPDRSFPGRVVRVAQQADSSSGWMNTDRKVYTTIVELDGDNTGGLLRSRMAGAVTILVDHLKDVLAVPLQAVHRDRSANYVWKESTNGPVAVPVEIGPHNAEHVVITKGIAVGDVIHLTTPPEAQPPTLEQPAVPMPAVPAPSDTKPQDAKPADAQQPAQGSGDAQQGERRGNRGGQGGGGQGGGAMGGGMPNMTEEQRAQFTEMRRLGTEVATFLKGKFPDRAEEIDDRRALSTMLEEPAVQTALKELGETWTKYDAMRQQMRSMMGGRGGQGGGGNR
jgi:HlyD family secretion protein